MIDSILFAQGILEPNPFYLPRNSNKTKGFWLMIDLVLFAKEF